MLGALATGEAWPGRFSTLRGIADPVIGKICNLTEPNTKLIC